MPILHTTGPEGLTYSFDPINGQWTAKAEGRKPTSSQNLSTLVERVSKWHTAPAPAPVAPEWVITGLAGVAEPASYRANALPELVVKSMTGKVGWEDGVAKLVRYQETGKDSWLTSRLNTHLLDPRTFTEEDQAYWIAVSTWHQGHAALVQAEQMLARAWQEQAPVDTQIIRISGRPAVRNSQYKGADETGKPITWEKVARAPQSETRAYAAVSSAWPVLPGAPSLDLTTDDLADWPEDATGALCHASGLRVTLELSRFSSAEFKLIRPDPKGVGPDQVLYTSDDFVTVFQLAQLTLEVARQALPEMPQWRATSAGWLTPSSDRAPNWPAHVRTQAMGLVFVGASHNTEIVPFLLQTIPDPIVSEALVSHPVWRSQSRHPEIQYLSCGPADALLDQLSTLRTWEKAFEQALAPALVDGKALLAKMHQAALQHAYDDGGDGETCEPAVAAHRLQRAFDRIGRQAANAAAIKELTQNISTLHTNLSDLQAAAPTSSRRRAPR